MKKFGNCNNELGVYLNPHTKSELISNPKISVMLDQFTQHSDHPSMPRQLLAQSHSGLRHKSGQDGDEKLEESNENGVRVMGV